MLTWQKMRIFQKKRCVAFKKKDMWCFQKKKDMWHILAILAEPKVYGRFHVELLNWESVGVSILSIQAYGRISVENVDLVKNEIFSKKEDVWRFQKKMCGVSKKKRCVADISNISKPKGIWQISH